MYYKCVLIKEFGRHYLVKKIYFYTDQYLLDDTVIEVYTL